MDNEKAVKKAVGLIALIGVLLLASCAPTENITAIKESSYNQGYELGYGKGYIKGGEDTRTGIEDIKQNAYNNGYAAGYDNVTLDIKDSTQSNSPVFTTTFPVNSGAFPGKYVGDKSTNIYHLPLCVLANQISPANQLWSNSAGSYSASGMKPCELCKPPRR